MTSGIIPSVIPERGVGSSRWRAIERDLRLLRSAALLIAQLGEELDQRLEAEVQPSERLRLVRETTVQITRTANDAIKGYRNTKQFLDTSVAGARGDGQEFTAIRTRLSTERRALLAALDRAAARYP